VLPVLDGLAPVLLPLGLQVVSHPLRKVHEAGEAILDLLLRRLQALLLLLPGRLLQQRRGLLRLALLPPLLVLGRLHLLRALPLLLAGEAPVLVIFAHGNLPPVPLPGGVLPVLDGLEPVLLPLGLRVSRHLLWEVEEVGKAILVRGRLRCGRLLRGRLLQQRRGVVEAGPACDGGHAGDAACAEELHGSSRGYRGGA